MNIDVNISRLLQDEMQQLRLDIIDKLQQAGKAVTGRTASIIKTAVNGNNAELQFPSYISTLENGRGPARGGRSDKEQFIQNLKEWIVAKGISYKDEDDLQRLANFFRWYINKFGTKQYRQKYTKDIVTSAISKLTKSVKEKIPTVYADVLSEIMN